MQELLQKIHADFWNRNFVQGYVSNRSCKEHGCIHKERRQIFTVLQGLGGRLTMGLLTGWKSFFKKSMLSDIARKAFLHKIVWRRSRRRSTDCSPMGITTTEESI
ncbi:hypothetical protein VPH35_005517 [Triticum aestivum]